MAKSESDYSPLFVALAFRNWLHYHHYDFKKFIGDDLVTLLCKFGELWSSNPGVYERERCYPVVSFFKINISDKLSQEYWTNFHQIFTIW